ncbi:hypothetical protein [Rubneribacter sp.]|nr:hypothetical protein [Candidatus Rubneribacter avistercoris]
MVETMVENAGSLRGCLTDELAEKYRMRLGTGYPMTRTELRLIPYLHYLVVNRKRIEMEKIDHNEYAAMSVWICRGWLLDYPGKPVAVSKEFWDTMCDVLWDAYALHLVPAEPSRG